MSVKPASRALVLVVLLLAPAARAQEQDSLEHGYSLMYGLDFTSAGQVFSEWRTRYPCDPLGPMSEAARILFAELDRSGVLQAQFFVDDSFLTSTRPSAPPPGVRERFDAAVADAERLASARLRDDPHDPGALFALAMAYGLRADYAALVEGRAIASLSYTRQASRVAQTLLEAAPDYADAHLASGISQYIIGSLIPPLRWILRVAGYQGSKARGMDEVRLTAERGRLLGPFARILLAIAYLRERDTVKARELLIGLERDFPSNPLFASELRRLDLQDTPRIINRDRR